MSVVGMESMLPVETCLERSRVEGHKKDGVIGIIEVAIVFNLTEKEC